MACMVLCATRRAAFRKITNLSSTVQAALAPYRGQAGLTISRISPSLEDVFIGLMDSAKDNFQ